MGLFCKSNISVYKVYLYLSWFIGFVIYLLIYFKEMKIFLSFKRFIQKPLSVNMSCRCILLTHRYLVHVEILYSSLLIKQSEIHVLIRIIYTLEKKTQRERLNQRLRSSLKSTQFRIRNAPFFLKSFEICSINKFLLFSFIFYSLFKTFLVNTIFCFR